ncbi:hypothetical protein THIOKS1110003 [Thiocapsa sp. KS1]|nr:hypothetical protein THIOKS1110003 [Thiocapsa sp. KS1]
MSDVNEHRQPRSRSGPLSKPSKERIVTLVGIDLAKNSFHAYGVDAAGTTVFSKQLSRATFGPRFSKRPRTG